MGQLANGGGDLRAPGRRRDPGGGPAPGLGAEPVSGALRSVASVDELFRLDPLERFRALIDGDNFAPHLRCEPITFDIGDPIYGYGCAVEGCARHSTLAGRWCTRHAQQRWAALR